MRARRFIATLRRLAAATWPRLAVFTALAVLAEWPFLSHAGSMVDYRDAQYFTLFEDSARISVLKFHQLPLWNPYYCGGIYALGTPSARFTAPTFVLTLLFGTLRSSSIVAVLATIAGLEGTYRYARARGAGPLGAALAAPIFALSGFFPRSAAFEWINFLGFELLPWAALGLRRGLQGSLRGALLAAGAVGWMTCFGGTYAAPYMLLIGAWEAAEALWRLRRDRARIRVAIGNVALAAVLAAGLAAVRLWPIAETLAAAPRLLGALASIPPLEMLQLLFGRTIPMRGDFIVGVLVLPLALLAAIDRRALWLLVGALFWTWLASGYSAHPSGYAILRGIPPYTMLRSPERFLVPFAMLYAVLAARGLGKLQILVRARRGRRFGSPWIPVAAATLLGINAGVLVDNSWSWQRGRTLMAAPAELREASDFAKARGNRWLAAYYPGMARGTLSCFDDYQVPQSAALRGDLPHEELLAAADVGAGKVERVSWSPDRIELHVELSRPARVIVNQNWHPGWRSSLGFVTSDQDRLAVDLPEGAHDVTLRFLPRSAVGGIAATLLALGAIAFLLVYVRRRGEPRTPRAWTLCAAVATTPLWGVGLAFALVREPPRPPPRFVLPDGDPMIADAPPPQAEALGVRFTDGVTLQAARVVSHVVPEGPMVDLELDWRLAGPAPPGLGVFVHIEPDKGDVVNVDHVALATVAPFEAFPADKTLRDALPPIALEAGKTYKVYVGLWRARRGGERLPVVDKGSATLDGDRVVITTLHF
ncbi:MAG TPA: hypothetical protein VLM85_25385 [Polyangiaceae bacterium]|nr:hypothetical protein [Polyangiaceae bacterium]